MSTTAWLETTPNPADESLAGLNARQRAAVTHGEGPLLVLAGAGTGKTAVITRRIAWLVATRRARPSEILALTFTEKAAAEMQERVDVLVPYGFADVGISTFHSFGHRLLGEHALTLGLPGEPKVVSQAQVLVLLREHASPRSRWRWFSLLAAGPWAGGRAPVSCSRSPTRSVSIRGPRRTIGRRPFWRFSTKASCASIPRGRCAPPVRRAGR